MFRNSGICLLFVVCLAVGLTNGLSINQKRLKERLDTLRSMLHEKRQGGGPGPGSGGESGGGSGTGNGGGSGTGSGGGSGTGTHSEHGEDCEEDMHMWPFALIELVTFAGRCEKIYLHSPPEVYAFIPDSLHIGCQLTIALLMGLDEIDESVRMQLEIAMENHFHIFQCMNLQTEAFENQAAVEMNPNVDTSQFVDEGAPLFNLCEMVFGQMYQEIQAFDNDLLNTAAMFGIDLYAILEEAGISSGKRVISRDQKIKLVIGQLESLISKRKKK